MESFEKASHKPSTGSGDRCLVVAILESGLRLKDWCMRHGKSVSEASDIALMELAGDQKLRALVLDHIDHSAARVYHETGEQQFDCFAGTVFAMQTLSRGLDEKYVLEGLSMELLDTFLELRQQGKVTRKWLSALLSKRFKSCGRAYRFGELSRIALLAALLLGYHDEDPLFIWALENREGIEGLAPRRWSRVMSAVFEGTGYPRFDLWLSSDHEKEFVRRVYFDTDSLFCRRLLRDSAKELDDWNNAVSANRQFFAEFTHSFGFTPEHLSDYTVETFTKQARWLESNSSANEYTHQFLCKLYSHIVARLPDNQNRFTFETGLPPQLLDHHSLLQLWLDGYRAILRNPLCPVPEPDQWILFSSCDDHARQGARSVPVVMDLSLCDRRATDVVKEWAWYECENMRDTEWLLPELSRLFGIVVHSAGWQREEPEIDLESVARYLDGKSDAMDQSAMLYATGIIRSILRYGEVTGRWQVEESVYCLLEACDGSGGRMLV